MARFASILGGAAALVGAAGLAAPARANAVTDWNAIAAHVLSSSLWQAGKDAYGLAMVQAAVFDAVDALHPRYLPYLTGVRALAGASDVAAVAEAARRVLRALAPDEADEIDAARESAVAGIDPQARDRGLAVGDAAAAGIIGQRRRQGAFWAKEGPAGMMGPSPEEPSDDAKLPLLNVDQGPPFVLTGVDQFLPPPPPDHDSPQARRDLAETLWLGAADSIARTPEQSRIAHFHVYAGPSPRSDIARQAIKARGLDLVDSARLLALVDLALADCLSAGTSAKYTYKYWRPDKAAAATGHVGWRPAIGMPATPEYPCQHCANGSAGQAVLEAVLGDQPIFFAITSRSSHETRRYRSFRQYAEEEAISRIYGGVHYRWSEVAGAALGRQVGDYVVATALTPIGGKARD